MLPLDSIVSSLELARVGVAGGPGEKGCVSLLTRGGVLDDLHQWMNKDW